MAYELKSLLEGGYCIGCGACAFGDDRVQMTMDDFGLLQPTADPEALADKSKICPFTSSRNEDHIAGELYADVDGISYDKQIGYYLGLYAGHVNEGEYRRLASSGGITTWILAKLLKNKEIDGVIHVGQVSGSSRLFEYVVSNTPVDVHRNSKSRYYPVSFDSALESAIADPQKKYAFVGVPCQIKAVRLLCEKDARLKQAIVYFIGIFCGHQKSAAFSELLAWQQGAKPGTLEYIDFRLKDEHQPANRYAVEVVAEGLKRAPVSTNRLYGSDWGLGFFKPKACDWCDDISAETADIVLGDAWLPEYVSDSRGTNIVITRNPRLNELVTEAAQSGPLRLDSLHPDKIVESQAANYRHRREGLSVRIDNASKTDTWHPTKRVKVDDFDVGETRKKIYLLRSQLSERSHIEFLKAKRMNSLIIFLTKMISTELEYFWLTAGFRGLYKCTSSRLRMLYSFLKNGLK